MSAEAAAIAYELRRIRLALERMSPPPPPPEEKPHRKPRGRVVVL